MTLLSFIVANLGKIKKKTKEFLIFFYYFFFFFAIRLTPVGKNFLVLLGLVPVNIQSANSMSADALALALTVALAAFVLAIRYKKK